MGHIIEYGKLMTGKAVVHAFKRAANWWECGRNGTVGWTPEGGEKAAWAVSNIRRGAGVIGSGECVGTL